jgi:hypothetical protein
VKVWRYARGNVRARENWTRIVCKDRASHGFRVARAANTRLIA